MMGRDTIEARYGSRINERIGDLVFVRLLTIRGDRNRLLGNFRCSCGKSITLPVGRALNGRYRTHCGCLTDRGSHRTHGMHGSAEYSSWQAMKARCLDPDNKDFPRWGGIGITIFSGWVDSFEAFFKHIGQRPPGTTLDRIDGRLGYEPGNVRWATPKQQARNRRDLTVVMTPHGRMVLVDYAKLIGITKGAAHLRLKRGKLEGVHRV